MIVHNNDDSSNEHGNHKNDNNIDNNKTNHNNNHNSNHKNKNTNNDDSNYDNIKKMIMIIINQVSFLIQMKEKSQNREQLREILNLYIMQILKSFKMI